MLQTMLYLANQQSNNTLTELYNLPPGITPGGERGVCLTELQTVTLTGVIMIKSVRDLINSLSKSFDFKRIPATD